MGGNDAVIDEVFSKATQSIQKQVVMFGDFPEFPNSQYFSLLAMIERTQQRHSTW